jgi:hypothetical protein
VDANLEITGELTAITISKLMALNYAEELTEH